MPSLKILEYPYSQNLEHLFDAVRDLPSPVWFDSGKPGSVQGRFDIISAAPHLVLETQGQTTTISRQSAGPHSIVESTDNPFTLAQQALEEMGPVDTRQSTLPFCGGLAGYIGYQAGICGQSLKNFSPEHQAEMAGLPDLRLGYYTWALIVNHQSSKAWTVFHPACSAQLRKDVLARLASTERNGHTKTSKQDDNFRLSTPFEAAMTRHDYDKAFATIKDYIYAGDCYQVNFAQYFGATYSGDPWHAYRQLRTALPSPFSAFMSWQDKAILSLSPERFVKFSDNQVESRPIKGTAARGLSIADDREKAAALINSVKDRAENLMIVDLIRNDLGKSCLPGSIQVPGLFDLESFANVHHLVSTVTGTVAKNKTALDLLSDCFPGGSITGAPKKRAMEIIQELELVKRSIYCGNIAYISACGRMDSSIAIRTLAANGGKLHCWGGGGIVADSVAEDEYNESLAKVSLLMDTLSG